MTRATPRPAKGTAAKAQRAHRNAKARHWRHVCQVVDARDLRCCRACGYSSVWIDHHHIVKRSQGGEDTPSNVVTLCRQCHAYVHAAQLYITGTAEKLAISMRLTSESSRG